MRQVLFTYLATIRADMIRGQVKYPSAITEEKHGFVRFDTARPEGPTEQEREVSKAPPGFWDGFPGAVTAEDLAFAAKQERWVRVYGPKKAAEMAREEKRRRKEAKAAGGG